MVRLMLFSRFGAAWFWDSLSSGDTEADHGGTMEGGQKYEAEQVDAPNPSIALWLTIESPGLGVGDPDRYAHRRAQL